MKRLSVFLAAIVAVLLMAGPSFAGGIDMGSWEEFTGMTSGPVYIPNHHVVVNKSQARSTAYVVTLNYETGVINYGTVGENTGIESSKGVIHEYYGVAPTWSESKRMTGTVPKSYEKTQEMDMFLY